MSNLDRNFPETGLEKNGGVDLDKIEKKLKEEGIKSSTTEAMVRSMAKKIEKGSRSLEKSSNPN